MLVARRIAVPPLLAAFAATTVLAGVLAGCSGSSGKSASPTTSARTGGAGLPTASGTYGTKPTLTFPGQKPPSTLRSEVLSQGSGPVVHKGDLLVADYLGQIWGGKVFDNSYDRGEPAGFQIGAGKVIPGWDETLVGAKAGSRMLLVIPPAKGYGARGNPQAGIKGTDTLVFVVDIVDAYGKGATASAKAAPARSAPRGLKVGGSLGSRPTLSVVKGTKPPKKAITTVLAKGDGAVVKTGLVVVQYEAVTWTNRPAGSTWQDGVPVSAPVGVGEGSPFDSLVGVPVGSRVLLELPAQKGSAANTAVAAVVDIVAEPPPAKDVAHR